MFSELNGADSDVLGAPRHLKLVSSELTSLRISWAAGDLNENADEVNYQVSHYRFDRHFCLIGLVLSLIDFADKTMNERVLRSSFRLIRVRLFPTVYRIMLVFECKFSFKN